MSTSTSTVKTILVPTSTEEREIQVFLRQISSQLAGGVNPVTVDCKSLVRVASSHVNALWQGRQLCREAGGRLELHEVSDGLRRVLQVLDLADLFMISGESALPWTKSSPSHDPKTTELSDCFAPTVADIDRVMSKLVAFLIRAGAPEVTAFELQTIFYEVATNIRCHAQVRSGDHVCVNAVVASQRVSLTFSDPGVGFDPTKDHIDMDMEKAAREQRRRGFGLAMIKRLSDRIEYLRDQNGSNIVTIERGW